MLRSIDISRAGMLRQGQALDVAANNTVNANTPGYKVIRAALESGDAPPAADADGAGNGAPALEPRVTISRLFTQGAIRPSDAPTDMAIDGEGFFTVRRPDGSTAYTRNGEFRPDAQGRLVDLAGNALQPGITLPAGAGGMQIAADGQVTVTLPNGRTQPAGQITLARFINPNGLLSGADNLYTETAASGPAQTAAPGQNGIGTVRAGALEDANGQPLFSVMAAQRAYQLNTSAFKMADEMLRMAGSLANGSA